MHPIPDNINALYDTKILFCQHNKTILETPNVLSHGLTLLGIQIQLYIISIDF